MDKLLTECTNNDPDARPSMDQVARQLAEWVTFEEDFGAIRIDPGIEDILLSSYVR